MPTIPKFTDVLLILTVFTRRAAHKRRKWHTRALLTQISATTRSSDTLHVYGTGAPADHRKIACDQEHLQFRSRRSVDRY
jgi:hypothetical protein